MMIERDTKGFTPGAKSVGDTDTVLLGPENLLAFDRKAFTVRNSGAQAFEACRIQATAVESSVGVPSTLDADWETLDDTTLATLAPGTVRSVQISRDSRKWWRVVAKAASGQTTTAQAWCHAAGS